MTAEIKTRSIRAFAWNEGETPQEVPCYEEFDHVQHALMNILETKEYGKFVRTYTASPNSPSGELVLWYRTYEDPDRGRHVVSGLNEQELAKSYEDLKRAAL